MLALFSLGSKAVIPNLAGKVCSYVYTEQTGGIDNNGLKGHLPHQRQGKLSVGKVMQFCEVRTLANDKMNCHS